jgi:hypothetical protein
MRVVIRVVVFLLALLVVAAHGSAAFGAAGPVVVHPNWRVVASGSLEAVSVEAVGTDRYAVIFRGSTAGVQLTLIDKQTDAEETLSPPSCSPVVNGLLLLGGPWLMVECGNTGPPDTYMLYNIPSGQWSPFTVSSACGFLCGVPGAIGSYWVQLADFRLHSPDLIYLQNIQSGTVMPDPVSPGGPIYDDLSTPAGTAPLCPPLRYPTDYTYFPTPQPGSLRFYGDFALLFGQQLVGSGPSADPGAHVASLRRCNSDLNLTFPVPSGHDLYGEPLASSAAVMETVDGKTLDGWLLPTLQRFMFTPPAATQVGSCGGLPPVAPADPNEVIPVALTARTIYVRNFCGTQRLWAASLPSPASLIRCRVPNVRGKTLASARASIRSAHCRIGNVAQAYSTHITAGRVISQQPKPGSILARSAKLHLVLSRGKRQ